MVAYVVEQLDPVILTGNAALCDMDLMSPFVWREADCHRIMVRAVPRPQSPSAPTGLILCGKGDDGLRFAMDDCPAISPGAGTADAGGCEDPTVVVTDDGYTIYFTGVDAAHEQGSLLKAQGPDLVHLAKQQVMLQAPPGEGNIKEATLAQAQDGSWRLFYEYAAKDASRIGMAIGPNKDGPWSIVDDPFGIRPDSWDNWHLSTGPMITIEGQEPVMFYNGATHDARWRIGWISFDPNFTRVTGRGIEPLLIPPPAQDRSATDIAFAASAIIKDDLIALYYSLEDRMLRRALVRRYG